MKKRVLALAAWALSNGYHTQVNDGLRGTLVTFTENRYQLYSGRHLSGGGGLPGTWSGAGIRAHSGLNRFLPYEEITQHDILETKQFLLEYKTAYPPGSSNRGRYRDLYKNYLIICVG